VTTAPRVRWGVLGAGDIAIGAHVPAIQHSSNAELWAIGSRREDRAQELARRTGAPRAYGSYEALLDDPEVDAVYIGLPNGLHETWTVAAARAGKHVLCDKSLAFDGASAERMRAACASAGVRLMEGFMIRHHPQWDVVRAILDGEKIGTLRTIDAWLSGAARDDDHRWSTELGGGALYDVTTYGINIARFMTREEPTVVSAVASMRGGVDESSAIVLRFPSGVLATASGSLCSAPSQGARFVGARGELLMNDPVVTTFAGTTMVLTHEGRSETIRVPGANHFLHQIEHFSSCVRDAQRGLWPAEDGVANAAVCEAARATFR
jgi:D-xylose 1-dehydrogenase (NADP+, D-xylono-1,5-lactone-forming)